MAILPPFWQAKINDGEFYWKNVNLTGLSADYRTTVWGQVIPLSQGARAIPGAPIWATETQMSIVYSEDVSNQHFDGIDATYRALVPTATYSKSFAVAFGRNLAPENEHAKPKLNRLWVNNALIYDASSGFVNNTLYPNIDFTFYTGTSTQTADPTIQADRGDLTPSYKNLIYVVIRNLIVWQNTGEGVLQLISANVTHQSNVPPTNIYAVPDVRAELIDGSEIASVREPYTLTDVDNLPSNSGLLMPDWNSRTLVQVIEKSSGHDWILTFDMDSEVETSSLLITGDIDGSPYDHLNGFGDKFAAWDTKNDVLWGSASGNNGSPIVVINHQTGEIIAQTGSGTLGTTGAPIDEDGLNPFTTGKDVFLPRIILDGDVGFYRIGGQTLPIMGGGDDGGAFYSCITHGAYQLDAQMPSEGCHDFAADPEWDSIGFRFFKFLNLVDLPQAARVADQDAIGIFCAGTKAYAIYLKAYGSRSKILASKVIHTFADTIGGFYQDTDFGLIFVTDDGSHTHITRIVPAVHGAGDVSWGGSSAARPDGFAGLVPDFAGATISYENVQTSGRFSNVLTAQSMRSLVKRSDASRGEVGVLFSDHEWTILNLRAGTSQGFDFGISGFNRALWDEVKQGFVGQASDNISFVPLREHLNYVPMELDHVLKWLALAYGYDGSHQTIDALLTDPVLGIALQRDFASDKLFGDMGQLYNFTNFESEGKIKFVKLARNPVKASATIIFHAQVHDGDEAMVETDTYVFRAVPALPFEVKIGALLINSIDNFVAAINHTGTDGVEYAAGTTQSAFVTAAATAANVVTYTAIHGGAAGDAIHLNESSGGRLGVSAGNLIGGADAVESDFSFTRDNMLPVAEGGAGSNDVLITTLNQPSGGVASVQVTYFDWDKLYSEQTTIFTNDSQTALDNAAGKLQLDTPIVFSEAEAYQRAAKIGLQQATASITQEFRAGLQGLTMEPVDVALITIPPYAYLVKLDEVTYNADWSTSLSGLNYSARDDIAIPPMVVIHDDPSAKTTGDAVPLVLDIPLPSPGYADVPGSFTLFEGIRSFGQPGFTLCALSVTFNSIVTNLTNFSQPVPYGLAVDKLPDTSTPYITDEVTTLRVSCKTMAADVFATASSADFHSGKNTIVVGAPGRWEIIFFRDVTQISDTLVQLSGLMRGRRGTNGFTGTHLVADQVYLMASVAATFQPGGQFAESRVIADAGDVAIYATAATPAQKPPQVLAITYAGLSVYPFSPAKLRAAPGASSSVDLSWVRRDRHSTGAWVTDPVPMSEALERYDVEIMSGASVVRAVADLTSPAYNYSAAHQTSDGFTAPVSTITFRVYQKGALGRGFKAEATRHVE